MKTIENKTTEINVNDGIERHTNCTYAKLIELLVIGYPKQGGFDYKDITHRMRINDVVKKANGTIDLEDADYEYLKKLVESMRWNFVHKDILQFKDDIC